MGVLIAPFGGQKRDSYSSPSPPYPAYLQIHGYPARAWRLQGSPVGRIMAPASTHVKVDGTWECEKNTVIFLPGAQKKTSAFVINANIKSVITDAL